MPDSLLPPTKADELHRRIEAELPDRGNNTAAAVRRLLHGILAARVEAPADWKPSDWAAPEQE